MSERNLVICDKEIRYANGLGENISARNEFALRVHICTSMDSVLQFKKSRRIHILIVDEAFTYADRKEMDAEYTFILTKDQCQDLGENEKEVYKYQSAERILSEIFESYCEQTNSNILRSIKKQKKKLLGVYSPIHRVGKTTFAIELGKALAKKERTLYLNLEEYPDVGGRFLRAVGGNLGDLFYYMYQENGNVPLRLSTMVVQVENLDYIPPFLTCDDLKQISVEEWRKLIEIILEESIYETIIMDLSDSIQGLWEMLQCCDRIYMPILEDEISKKKIQSFKENQKRMQLQGLKEKIYEFAAEEDMAMRARKLVQEET